MIGINKCLSVKLCTLLTWLQSSWKPLNYIFKMGVNRKFDFRRVWKFCWDVISNVISDGNWHFRWDSVFSGGTLYPSVNYGLTIIQSLCTIIIIIKQVPPSSKITVIFKTVIIKIHSAFLNIYHFITNDDPVLSLQLDSSFFFKDCWVLW